MDLKIMNFSEFHKDNIAMSNEDWDKAKGETGAMGLTNERAMQVYWEGMAWTDGFPDCLKGLSLEEQIDHYVVKEYSEYSRSSYGEIDKTKLTSGSFIPLKDYKRFHGVIVKDDVVVGALVSDYYGNEVPLHPGRPRCIYWSIDSDGTGSSSSDVYVHMYCVPFENK